MLSGLDLFSGIGGISLALSPWVRPVAYCENDRYAQAVLLSRMQSRAIEPAPIWDDVRTLTRDRLGDAGGRIDIIYAGFPCQDISVAGAGAGLAGERSNLFFEVVRIAKEVRPSFLFFENVPAIRTRGLARVCHELARLGYDCRWTSVSAAELGAAHLRQRWFLLAYAGRERLEGLELHEGARESFAALDSVPVYPIRPLSDRPALRVANELPRPMDEIRALGNAVVPAQAREAFMRLSGLKEYAEGERAHD